MKRRNVLLDLDNTILCAENLDKFPFDRADIKQKVCNMNIHNMENYYIIFERPYVQDFLDTLFKEYNVAVWTAASKDYALFVINEIILKKPERKLDFIMFSYHCDISKKLYSTPKKLKLIFDILDIPNYNEDNTIIIDDLDDVYKAQPSNCINIKGFEILDEQSGYDKELKHMIKRVEEKFDDID